MINITRSYDMDNNLELYKVFHTVASCGNISLASERLFISQPAVSKTIKKLEGITGVTLFWRNSRGVKLTEEGKVLFEYVEKALNEIAVAEKVLEKFKKREQGSIKIGVSTILCKHFFIPTLKKFMKEYPHIEFKITNKSTLETLKLIELGEIDLCIVSGFTDILQGDYFNFVKLTEVQDAFVASKGYLETLSITENTDIFSKGTLMLLEKDNISRRYIDKYFHNNGIVVKPEIEISNMDLLIEFAKIGLGITVAIKDLIQKEIKEGSLVEIPISPPIPKREIGVVYHKNIPLSLAAQTFLQYLL
jgi:LysR family transcriptional regulator, transcriptional activator of the cysJI operon